MRVCTPRRFLANRNPQASGMLIFAFYVLLFEVVNVPLAELRKLGFVTVDRDPVFHGFELLRWSRFR